MFPKEEMVFINLYRITFELEDEQDFYQVYL